MGTDQETVEKTAEKAIETKSDSIRQEYAFADDVKLKECKYCRVMIPKKAKICPNCKMILKRYTFLKLIASVLGIAVIGTGSYCLAAYWGLLPDSAIPAWIAQNKITAPVVSVTSVETAEAAAGARTVEPTEVAADMEAVEAVEISENQSSMEELREESNSAAQSGSAQAEDAVNNTTETEVISSLEGLSVLGVEYAAEDRADPEESETYDDEADAEDKADSEDINTMDDINTAEDEDAENEDPAAGLEDMDENEAAFRADCVRRKYKALLRDKDYLGTTVLVMEAEVVCQVDGGLFDENVYYLCMEEENGIECYYIIRDDRETDETLILEGDIITVYGRLFGTCKIPADLITTRPTVPAISMLTYDLLEE